jgi:hypothetical protein
MRGRFDLVVVPWKFMNTHVTLKVDLPVQVAPERPEFAGILRAGEQATIVRTDDRSWCYIECETGGAGYFAVVGASRIAGAELAATDVFDGLCMAD